MKIMTWNIWGGRHLDEVIELLESENPDILGLQEVKEIDGQNSAKSIAEKLGYQYVYCKSFTTDRHTPSYDLGNAILSKFPIKRSQCHFLSTLEQYENSSKTEPRTAVEVDIEVGDQTLTIITTHLGYTDQFGESEIRDYQLNNLLNIIDDKRCILMGDFNSLPTSRIIKKLSEVLVNTDPEGEEISYTEQKIETHPQYRIDYIFAEKSISFSKFRIAESEASDHRPLIVEVK